MEKYRVCAGSIDPASVSDDESIVVVDSLRASSTIITALALGIQTIVPVRNDADARLLQKNGAVIAGESGGKKIDGYDIGNSPVELQTTYDLRPFTVLGIKTSNLVPLLRTLPSAYICTGLNLSAVRSALRDSRVCILAVGGQHGVSEDLGPALALAAVLSGVSCADTLISSFIRESSAARHLAGIGYADDIDFIARVNVYDVLPWYDGTQIVNKQP